MFDKNKLIVGDCPAINFDLELNAVLHHLQEGVESVDEKSFISKFEERLKQYQSLHLRGLENFKHRDVIRGCTQYINDLIESHGLANIQLFEHGYSYYRRLDPKKEYSTIQTLTSDRILLLELPFPGHLGPRRDIDEILQRCNEEGIEVHLDCAWLTCGMDIEFDFNQPCIQSVGMSLSKCYGLGWSKVGVRWSKVPMQHQPIPKTTLEIGMMYLKKLPMDHLVQKYRSRYHEICRVLRLRPGKVLIGAHKIDHGQVYGLRDFFTTS